MSTSLATLRHRDPSVLPNPAVTRRSACLLGLGFVGGHALAATQPPRSHATAEADAESPEPETAWRSRLFAPTHVTKLDGVYFIVDCWNHRCLYAHAWSDDLADWRTLDEQLAGPHSIATDGRLFVVEDTGHHGLRVYRRDGERFAYLHDVGGLGERTHRVVYDAATAAFFVVASNSQHLARLEADGDRLRLIDIRELSFLEGRYTRSMTLDGETMLFVAGPDRITRTTYRDGRYRVLATYRVPEGFASMNDVYHASDGWWYLTATPQRIVRSPSLEALDAGRHQDLYDALGFDGTPYYLDEFDGRLFIPQITQHNGVLSFRLGPDGPTDRRVHFDFGQPTAVDWHRYSQWPK